MKRVPFCGSGVSTRMLSVFSALWCGLGMHSALAVTPDFSRICTPAAAPVAAKAVAPGVGQLLPGRYYSPKRSGHGWDFFWYGNSLEAGSSAANDKLFVTFYTYEMRNGYWAPAWYGATFDPAQPGNGGNGFNTQAVNGNTFRTSWNGVLYRFNQVSFAGGYGPIRQSDPAAATAGQGAQQIGKLTVHFGADGIDAGQRPNEAAIQWSLNASTLHPGAPTTRVEDCLVNSIAANQTQPSADAGYVGVWAERDSAAGWFWTPVFWNFQGVENEHHLLSYFNADGAPSWILAGNSPQVCNVNGQTYPPAATAPAKALCAMRATGYAPWQMLCSQGGTPGTCSNWNSVDYQFRVGKLIRGGWSLSPTGVNRSELNVVSEIGPGTGSVPIDRSPLSLPMTTASPSFPSVPRAPFNGAVTVSQLTGFTRIRVTDVVNPLELASCTVTAAGGQSKPGMCNLRAHFMTEGAHPGLVIVRRRVVGASGPDDMHVVSTGMMRSPTDGLPFPANNASPGDAESLLIGDQFYFQAFVDQATAQQIPTPTPLFSTERFLVKRPNQLCSGTDELMQTPALTVLARTGVDQPFRITAPAEAGLRRVYGVRLRVYLAGSKKLFAERLQTLNLSQAALDQTINISGLVAGQAYTAKAEVFNHCTVKTTAVVTLNPPQVTMTQPSANLAITAATPVSLSLQATDDGGVNTGSARFVISKQGGTTIELVAPLSGSVYNATWTPDPGSYSVYARASDLLGLVGISTPQRVVTVAAPVVTISASPNTQLTAPATVALTATVNTSAGLSGVSFIKADGAAICAGVNVSGVYSCNWNGIAAGSHSIRARATINSQAYESIAMNLTVSAAPTTVTATRTYVYDSFQRLCKLIEPETGATVYDYDAAGNIAWSAEGTALTGPNCDRDSVPMANRILRTYDAMNRVEHLSYPGAAAGIDYTYEPDGVVNSITTAGNTWNYSYNKRRLLEAETLKIDGGAYGFGYAYDANGHAAALTYPDGSTVDYAPNALGQPTQVGVYATAIGYYPNGAISGFTYGNGVVQSISQNTRQLPQRNLAIKGGKVLLDDTYQFDANANVSRIDDLAEAGRSSRQMSYDGLDRLRSALASGMWGNATFSYDALDNIRSNDHDTRQLRYVYNPQNNRLTQLTNGAGATQMAIGHNAAGDITTKGVASYSFDTAHRLLGIAGVANYVYDGHGRRAKESRIGIKGGGTEYSIYNMTGTLLYRKDQNGIDISRMVYLNGRLIATIQSGAPPVVTYALTDGIGSVVAATDSNGDLIRRYRYSPYGESLGVATGTIMDGPGYAGHLMEPETGLTYMQQRYQDPILGRFLAADPIVADTTNAWNFNRYNYGATNPFRFTDPDGRSASCCNYGGAMWNTVGNQFVGAIGTAQEAVKKVKDVVADNTAVTLEANAALGVGATKTWGLHNASDSGGMLIGEGVSLSLNAELKEPLTIPLGGSKSLAYLAFDYAIPKQSSSFKLCVFGCFSISMNYDGAALKINPKAGIGIGEFAGLGLKFDQ